MNVKWNSRESLSDGKECPPREGNNLWEDRQKFRNWAKTSGADIA